MSDFRDELAAWIRAFGTPWRARRGESIQRPHAPTSPLYLIDEGAAHAYVDTERGRQTLRLGYPGEVLADLPSLFLDAPTAIGIEALRRCAGFAVGAGRLRGYVYADPARHRRYTGMLEGFACGLMARELDLLEDSPRERYAAVLARSPQVFQYVPLRYIASYLRMTPETLSRVRARAAATARANP